MPAALTFTPDRLAGLCPAVLAGVRAAGRAIMRFYGSADIGLAAKRDDSPVTAADLAADTILQGALAGLVPDCPVVSEERAGEWPPERRRGLRQCWLVDPLDGTKEFVAGNGEFCVCVALVQDGAPVLGAIHLPASGQTYVAHRGGGHVERYGRDPSQSSETRVSLPKLPPLDPGRPGLRIAVSRRHAGAATEAYLARYPSPVTVAVGSAIKFCAIAEGRLDLYPRFGPTMAWDTAAGQCLVEVAGRRVVDVDTGAPLRYDRDSLVNPGFVAGL